MKDSLDAPEEKRYENVLLSAEERLEYALKEIAQLSRERNEAYRRIEMLEQAFDAVEVLARVANDADAGVLKLVKVGIDAIVASAE